ncbi:MAG: endolytic transglycosylase MltG [Acidimicrobiia bacterium]|nr:endolytic transglycosylase MltG [Acidimicrobiia bacterium]
MRRLLLTLVLLIGLAGIGAYVAGTAVWGRLHEPFKGYEGAEQFVDIPPGTGIPEIRRRFVAAGVVRDEALLRAALWWTGEARNLRAGEYRFDQPMTPIEVVEKLARGDVYARSITFPEGLTMQEMARLYEMREFGKASAFIEAARNAALITDLDPDARDLEGYLFPDTYALPRGTPASRLVALMVDRFKATYTEETRAAAEEQDLTTRQVVTLASLVEKETGQPDERPVIAAVYRNRLRIRMPMQADPTVVYAMMRAGTYNGNLRRDDLSMDSPYNTYRYPGLPPGPIAAPGKASLDAALMPAAVPYLYFVSRNDGSHVFARTLAEHNRNVREFQVEFFRRRR